MFYGGVFWFGPVWFDAFAVLLVWCVCVVVFVLLCCVVLLCVWFCVYCV